MKKTLLVGMLSWFIISCGNNNNKTNSSETKPAATEPKADPEVDKGLTLVTKNDCLTCHKISEPLIGPPYQKVAQKYTASPEVIDSLAQKIIKGGSGNWGTVAMTPHQSLSKEDAQAMVKYILSLK
jgi:cytochrome c